MISLIKLLIVIMILKITELMIIIIKVNTKVYTNGNYKRNHVSK